VQLNGAHWRRREDCVGLAGFRHDISRSHREYLARGGLGFLLGDGRLTYGPEVGLEGYYRAQVGEFVQLTPDIQVIRDPGYNRDRGTATVVGLRFNLRY
jgi:carbohydrate-selective porin OprB